MATKMSPYDATVANIRIVMVHTATGTCPVQLKKCHDTCNALKGDMGI